MNNIYEYKYINNIYIKYMNNICINIGESYIPYLPY